MRSLALISKQGSVSSLFLPGGIPLTFSRSLFEPRSFVVRYRTRVCESSLTLNTASHPDKPVHGEGIYIPCFIFIKGQLWHFGTRPHISRVWRAVNTVRQLGTNSFSKAKIISCLFFFFFSFYLQPEGKWRLGSDESRKKKKSVDSVALSEFSATNTNRKSGCIFAGSKDVWVNVINNYFVHK